MGTNLFQNMDNKTEFKNFLKALKGAIILFAGICAGIGSLNFAAVSGQNFFTSTGVVSIVISAITGVGIFKEIWNEVGKPSAQTGGSAVETGKAKDKDKLNAE